MKKVVISVGLVLLMTNLFAQKENQQAISAMKNAIGSQIRHYTPYSYPTNNFGIGTSCYRKWVPRGTMMCDMVESFGLNTLSSENSQAWKNVNGYAYYGVGGPLTLNDTINSEYAVDLLLPKIFNTLRIALNIGKTKTNSVKLTIDSAVVRYLKFDTFRNYVLSQKNRSLYNAWQKRKLLVVTSDYVLLDYSIEINPSDSFGLFLQAKLDSINNIAPNLLAQNDSLGVKISKQSDGRFTLKSDKPIVFAVFITKQKQIAPQGETKDWSDWGDADAEGASNNSDTFIDPAVYSRNQSQ